MTTLEPSPQPPAKKVLISLTDTPKRTVEILAINVSGSNSVAMVVKMVELDITTNWGTDLTGWEQWRLQNPLLTFKEFLKNGLLSLYLSFETAKAFEKIVTGAMV